MHSENNPLLDRYIHWLETLSAQGAHRISQFVSADVRCRNPEFETSGVEGAGAFFAQIFQDAEKVTTRILDRAWGQHGQTIYLRWDRLIETHGNRETLSGISEIMFGMDGKITSITDYWDSVPQQPAGFFARLFRK